MKEKTKTPQSVISRLAKKKINGLSLATNGSHKHTEAL